MTVYNVCKRRRIIIIIILLLLLLSSLLLQRAGTVYNYYTDACAERGVGEDGARRHGTQYAYTITHTQILYTHERRRRILIIPYMYIDIFIIVYK